MIGSDTPSEEGAALRVTIRMKDAGSAALQTWIECCSADELVERVYIAMENERNRSRTSQKWHGDSQQ